MTRNKLSDLNNHLFEQLERLNDPELEGDALEAEIERSRAVSDISRQVIDNGRLVLSAAKMRAQMSGGGEFPKMLSGEE